MVVLRPEAVRQRLLRLEEVLSRLEELGDDRGDSFRDEWAVQRGLQLAAEIVFDIGNHVLSGHFGVAADDYEDVLEQLARHGVIQRDLRERLRGLAGFRNILVHDYLRLDPQRVAEHLSRVPHDIGDFARQLGDWLEGLAESDSPEC